jgi:beta-glucosidase/6-phospho-beta-glucosidase/beta-galactosidase
MRVRRRQSESSEYFHPVAPGAERLARHLNELRFMPLDLNYGRISTCDIFGYYVITRQYYDRYRLPVMHTETNNRYPHSTEVDAPTRLRRQWSNLVRLKTDGLPIIGFTWYSLIDQMDWDSLPTQNNGRVNHYGLCNLERCVQPVGKAYRQLISSWCEHISSGMLSLD